MEENFVNYNLAVLLQEKGINNFLLDYYISYTSNGTKVTSNHIKSIDGDLPVNHYACCTLSEAQKWLREVHGIHIIINYDFSYSLEKEYYFFRIRKLDSDNLITELLGENYDTYEQSLESAILESLKLIKV